MNWLLRGKTERITARTAVPTDRPALAALLAGTWRRHGILAVEEQVALLSNGLSAIAFVGEDAIGFLGLSPRAPTGAPSETWVDAPLIAVAANSPVAGIMRRLREAAFDRLRYRGAAGVMCLASEDWLIGSLRDAGFHEVDRVLSYVRPSSGPRLGRGPLPDAPVVCQLRPAAAAEATTILALNAAAFDPIWRYDERTVLSWLLTADHAVLAEAAGEPLGFALTTLSGAGGYAQLIRVATDPAAQGRGVGRQLVADALRHAWEAGTIGVSLNTQASNTAARRLYEDLDFQPTGGALAVLVDRV